ncbi:stress-induced protein YchH [Serratia symbiotica]|uniref:Uncharacterized protein YchH n=1 Tax=Serratia symbiotica SCt-VLC TaxID=1347341 RepID=A0A068R9Z7_9GAMM|nr:stress-induced protein YchH [Serratia symbiotica]CDG47522.1 Uncharacterized protein YchH [Serratia symbiotica SCt-VLC]
MKRRHVEKVGNFFMGLGLVVMISGGGYSILAEVSQFNLPPLYAQGAIRSIFIGALIWLVGARIGGREQVAERYWWINHVDKHCRDDPRRKLH